MGGFIITIIIALIAGWLGNSITGKQMSGDIWGVCVVALPGAWIGAYMPYFNTFGPKLMDIALIPAFLCALVAAVIFKVVRRVAKQAS
ncbi:transglycosylase [Acetivibrio mesophilus]|uniref:Transglycosylase n=1 Tax=Acetivibrio mesophilus TaxID=2487273 RepID=A0A4Q0I6T9_9FIRM|nr:transglycosylase [Acetivibrio mesophilus]ODM24943.1 transglycosylase [Clostridium sp. Bc-iso-3]RXE60060.1 transglycosylase [Acetivibrio mesophilus]HHV28718.1 transglycosylase [Clostridium sp.]